MISAWARMCKILGKEFQQYLPVVMGPLMKTASIKPEVALLDSRSQNDTQKQVGIKYKTNGKTQYLNMSASCSPGHGEHIGG